MKAPDTKAASDPTEGSPDPNRPAGPLSFRRVAPSDEAALREIYDGIGAWLHDVKGITTQWDRVTPAGLIRVLLHADETYLALRDGEAVGAVRVAAAPAVGLESWRDDALYVYSLAVRRRVAGQGLGQQILAWVEEQARARGRRYLRLDCMADNARLVRYYVDLGFSFLSRHPAEPRYALFEKRIE
jgi:ribosomal protein S18 acetylase RimI-like enzyme